jgi:hypothetical protein
MNLKTYLENLNQMVKENPSLLEYTVISSIDDEGNGFNEVYWEPSLGHFNEDGDFYSKENIEEEPEEYDEDIEINAICIN